MERGSIVRLRPRRRLVSLCVVGTASSPAKSGCRWCIRRRGRGSFIVLGNLFEDGSETRITIILLAIRSVAFQISHIKTIPLPFQVSRALKNSCSWLILFRFFGHLVAISNQNQSYL